MTKLHRLIADMAREGRICPEPLWWDRIWKEIDKRREVVQSNETLPPPLILSGWWGSNDDEKRKRFQQHLRWAEKYGALDLVEDLLFQMKPEDWHTSI